MDTGKSPVVHKDGLSLDEVRTCVARLTERQLDVLDSILETDKTLCELAHTDTVNLGHYLDTIYRRLGITHGGMTSADKRKAANIMYQIFDKDGYRPNDEDTKFLLQARDIVSDSSSHRVIGGHVPQPLPSAQDIAQVIDSLQGGTWKSDLFNSIVRGETNEQMLEHRRQTDPKADITTIESGVQQLYRFFKIQNSHDHNDAELRALLVSAHNIWRGEVISTTVAPTQETTETKLLPNVSPTASENHTDLEEEPMAEIDYTPIVSRISTLMSQGEVPPEHLKILEELAFHGQYTTVETLALFCNFTQKKVRICLTEMEADFGIPLLVSDDSEKRERHMRRVLMQAWKLYKEHSKAEEENLAPASALEPPTQPSTDGGTDTSEDSSSSSSGTAEVSSGEIPTVPLDLTSILSSIPAAVKGKELPESKIAILDYLAENLHADLAAIAVGTGMMESTVSIYLPQIKKLLNVPKSKLDSNKKRGDQERYWLALAWKEYRKNNPKDGKPEGNQKDTLSQHGEAQTLPETEHVQKADFPKVTEDTAGSDTGSEATVADVELSLSQGEQPEGMSETSSPQVQAAEAPAPLPASTEEPVHTAELLPEPEHRLGEGSTPEAIEETPRVPVETPAHKEPLPPTSEVPPQPEANPQPASVIASSTTIISSTDMIVRDPQTVCGMRLLWSFSPTFEEDQAKAYAEGYHVEQVGHTVSFHPVVQGVSVLVFVKRS